MLTLQEGRLAVRLARDALTNYIDKKKMIEEYTAALARARGRVKDCEDVVKHGRPRAEAKAAAQPEAVEVITAEQMQRARGKKRGDDAYWGD